MTRTTISLIATFLLIFTLAFPASQALRAQGSSSIYTPPTGSPERSQILDALRKPVQTELTKSVLFKVEVFNVLDTWAFIQGVPLQPDGKAMNYKGTPYFELVQDGTFEDWFCALLKKDSSGTWKVIDWNIGATDLVWEPWSETHKAPKAIFTHPK